MAAREATLEPGPATRFRDLGLSVSAAALQASPEETGAAIDRALARIGAAYGLDRLGFRRFAKSGNAELLHFWRRASPADWPEVLHPGQVGWLSKRLERGEIVAVRSLSELPAEAAEGARLLARMNTLSLLFCPLRLDGDAVGVVHAATEREERDWDTETIDELRCLVELLASAHARAERKLIAQRLEHNLQYLGLATWISSTLLMNEDEDVTDRTQEVLARVGEAYELDRLAVWEFDEVRQERSVIQRWLRDDGMDEPTRTALEDIPWAYARLQRGDVVSLESIADLPPEAAVDREFIERLGVRSGLLLPLERHGRLIGACAAATDRREREWSEKTVEELKLLCGMLASALARHRAGHAQRMSEEALHRAQRIAHVGSYLYTVSEDELVASPEWVRIYGAPSTRGAFETWVAGVHPEDRDRMRWAAERARTHGEGYELTYRVLRPDGSVRHVLDRAEVACTTDGETVQVLGTVLDVTERERAERALRDSEDKYHRLFELAEDGLLILRGERFVDCNTKCEELLGRPRVEILGRTPWELSPDRQRDGRSSEEAIRESLQRAYGGQPQRFAWLHTRGRSDEVDVEVAVTPVELGGEACLLIAYRDVSERRRRSELRAAQDSDEIVGRSPALLRCLREAQHAAATDTSVLVLGETGSGKQLIARTVHEYSSRKSGPFVAVHCAAPSHLVESELFGHEEDAFTGAVGREVGRIEAAHGGTLFLDEVGDLSLESQVKLLRALQEGVIQRVGGTHSIEVDVRLVAATSRDLHGAVRRGEFREDLYYRIHVFPIQLPPLRDRVDDIPLLARHFVEKHARRLGRHVESIAPGMLEALQRRPWRGNVRELENFIERALILSRGDVLDVEDDQGWEIPAGRVERPLRLRDAERRHIVEALHETRWVIEGRRGAAARLGLPPSTLRSRMKKLAIQRGDTAEPEES